MTFAALRTWLLAQQRQKLERDAARMRNHLQDIDPAVRKEARTWLRIIEAELLVLCRWQHEVML